MSYNPHAWLTVPIFYQFCGEVGLNLNCRMCHSTPQQHFVETGSEDGYVTRSSAYTSTDTGFVNMQDSRHVAAVRVTCIHCGHIDLYSAYVIELWRQRKLAAAQNSTPSLFGPGGPNVG